MTTILSFAAETVRQLPHLFRRETRPVSYDDLFKDPTDGCARYDDVWGG